MHHSVTSERSIGGNQFELGRISNHSRLWSKADDATVQESAPASIPTTAAPTAEVIHATMPPATGAKSRANPEAFSIRCSGSLTPILGKTVNEDATDPQHGKHTYETQRR
jgi:hypothetical protein